MMYVLFQVYAKHVFNTNNYFRDKSELPLIRKNTTASSPTLCIPAVIEVHGCGCEISNIIALHRSKLLYQASLHKYSTERTLFLCRKINPSDKYGRKGSVILR